jgi:N-acetylmuramoyl-L-alanine amidase
VRARGVVLITLVLLLAACSAGSAPARPTAAGTSPAPRTTPPATTTSSTTPPPPSSSPSATQTTAGFAPLVVLDPGHNGGNAAHPEVINAPVPDGTGGTKPCNTTGTATDAGYAEHAFTWDVAVRVRDRLTAAGVQVAMTRQDDAGVGPCVDERGRLAGQLAAAAFLSIHGDGSAAGNRGFHVITSSLDPAGPSVGAASRSLAIAVRDSLAAVEPVSNYIGADGLNARGDLAGLNLNAVPAVYVECGNMRNPADAALMSSAEGRQQIADRLAAGLLTFLGR